MKNQIISLSLIALVFSFTASQALAQGNSNEEQRGWVFRETSFEDFFSQIFGNKLKAELVGDKEVPGPGDIDGTGEAKVRIHEDKNELCVDLETEYIDRASAAHIHHAPAGSSGAVVVPLSVPDEDGEIDECVQVDKELLKAIKENPQDYYVNVHTNPYPNGAIRGQLSK